jgi:hypothetical protein
MLTRALAVLLVARVASADKVQAPVAIGGALAPALASALPTDGIYLSNHTKDFFIARLDAKGLRVLHRDADAGIRGHAWLDARTLITNDVVPYESDAANGLTIYRMNGDAAPVVEKLVVEAEEWRLGRIKLDHWDPILRVTARGEVWLEQCLKENKEAACTHARFLRVLGGKRMIAARAPAGVIVSERTIALPRLGRAPQGYQVAVYRPARGQRQGGFTCTGPNGARHDSPADDIERDPAFPVRPDRVRWILATPPIFEIAGAMDTPVATTVRTQEYYRACAHPQLLGFAMIRPRMWMETTWVQVPKPPMLAQDEVKLYIDEQLVATLAGRPNDTAFSP